MNPTLNSPKYAAPESLDYRLHKIQQERKNRKKFVPQLEQRYFRRNEGSTDYATIPEVTLAGDFVIEFDVLVTGDGDRILGTSSVVDGRFFARLVEGSGSEIQIGVIGSFAESIQTPIGFISQNVLSKISISRTGTSVTIRNITNGEVFTDSDFTSTPFVISKAFGHLSNNMQGILANLKIYDNGTLIRDYPLNDNSNILANRAASLGAELFVSPIVGSEWTDNGDGSYTLQGAGTYNELRIPVIADKEYLISFDVDERVINSLSVRSYNVMQTFNTTGSYAFVGTPTSAFISLTRVHNSSVDLTVSNISIRRADGYGTIINGNADDWGLFDKQADGDWLGQELVVNGGFDSDGGWALNGTSIAGGKLVFGTGTTYADQINLSAGSLYQFSFDVVDYNGASIGLSSLTVNPSYLVSAVGKYIVEDSAVNNYVRLVSTGSDLNAIDNVSVKEVLKNA